MKTLELIKTQLKGFVRNYKTVILLLGVPLLLVLLIIASFSTQGVTDIPFGVIQQDVYNLQQYEDNYLSFLQLHEFPTKNACLRAVDIYWVYGCIEITKQPTNIQVTVHYDNTREPIIWEVLQRIETTIEALQEQESQQAIQELLNETASTTTSIEYFSQGITQTKNSLETYKQELFEMQTDVEDSRIQLQQQLDNSQEDIDDIEDKISDYDQKRANTYSISKMLVYDARNIEYSLPPGEIRDDLSELITEFDQEIEDENTQARRDITEARQAIYRYRQASSQGREYVQDLQDTKNKLVVARQQLTTQQTQLNAYQQELLSMQQQLSSVGSMNADMFLNTILLSSTPTFVPDFSAYQAETSETAQPTAQEVNQAQSLMSLQTLYPTILMLLLLFLSLLVSTFLCLQEINNQASKRVRLIPHTFHAELISTYIASLLITIIPILCVLVAGEYLLILDIFAHIHSILIILLLLASCYILFGMGIAYTLRNESITLLLSTLLLIFFMFFSGFLFPTERMNNTFSAIANILPPKIGLETFNQVVFYQNSLAGINLPLTGLTIWMIFLALTTTIMKYVRQSN